MEQPNSLKKDFLKSQISTLSSFVKDVETKPFPTNKPENSAVLNVPIVTNKISVQK